MLDRLRGCFPSLRSLLMDRETLLRHEALWVEEANPYKGPLVRLTEEEHRVYQMLMNASRTGTYSIRMGLARFVTGMTSADRIVGVQEVPSSNLGGGPLGAHLEGSHDPRVTSARHKKAHRRPQ